LSFKDLTAQSKQLVKILKKIKFSVIRVKESVEGVRPFDKD